MDVKEASCVQQALKELAELRQRYNQLQQEYSASRLETEKKLNHMDMQLKQEQDKRQFYEKAASSSSELDSAKKIEQLEVKISEFRRHEVEFLKRIKELEDDVEDKDQEIDNLLSNFESNDVLERMAQIAGEKEDLEKKLAKLERERDQSPSDDDKPDRDLIELELRSTLEELSRKAKEDIDELYEDLNKAIAEKALLQEATNQAEAKAKDFEYIVEDLEYKIKKMERDSQEEALRAEVRTLRAEMENISTVQQKTTVESKELNTEIKALKLQLQEADNRYNLLSKSVVELESEKEKIILKLRETEKESRDVKELTGAKEKKILELQQRISETKLSLTETLDKTSKDYKDNLDKITQENFDLSLKMKQLKDELDVSRTRGVSLSAQIASANRSAQRDAAALDFMDQSGSNQSSPGLPAGPTRLSNVQTQHFDVPEEIKEEDDEDKDRFEPIDTLALVREHSGSNATGLAPIPMARRDTQDGRLSVTQSRRNSNLSTAKFQFRMHKTDEKLVAEIAELKNKLRETQDEQAKKVQELLAEIDQKNQEINTLNDKVAEIRKQEKQLDLLNLDFKLKEESLRNEIKNLQAELRHTKEENEYCRTAATDASLKIAHICEDYETNQVALMKRNRSYLDQSRRLTTALEAISEAVTKEKVKSSAIAEAIKQFRSVQTPSV